MALEPITHPTVVFQTSVPSMGRHLVLVCLLTGLLQACGARSEVPLREPSLPTVDVMVRGEIDTTIQQGLAQVDHAASTTGQSGRRFTLVLRPRRSPDPVVVLGNLPFNLGPGQVPLNVADSTQRPSAYYAQVVDAQQVVYDRDVQGTLAITDTSDGLSGRFRFGVSRARPDSVAESTATQSAASDTAQARPVPPDLVIEGTFRRVPRLQPRPIPRPGATPPASPPTPEGSPASD